MSGLTKRRRELNRSTARKRVGELESIATVRINDQHGAHWTVTLQNNIRIDYWPGAGKWQSAHSGAGTGDFDDLLRRASEDASFQPRDDDGLPDWFVLQIRDLRPEPRKAFIKIHHQCVRERAFGEAYGLRFGQLFDLEVFGRGVPKREIVTAVHVDDPEPGVRLTYSDGFTKFEADAARWTRAAA